MEKNSCDLWFFYVAKGTLMAFNNLVYFIIERLGKIGLGYDDQHLVTRVDKP